MKTRILALAVGLTALSALPLPAEVRISGLFSDRAVLQRNQPMPIWGWADPGEAVTVTFAGQTRQTVADRRGTWRVTLEPLVASEEPRVLTAQGRNRVAISEIVVGEVWLGAGQYNMARLMSELAAGRPDIESAGDPLLRCFRVPNRPGERPWPDVEGRWLSWNRKEAPQFSSFAFYFGQRLRRELGVPVGLLSCAWGSSGIAAWISPDGFRTPELRGVWPEDIWGARITTQPSRLYHGMLHPLVPAAIAGVLWYQGETDAEPYSNPFLYRHLFTALIQDWRQSWDRPDLPFYWVQLPNLRERPGWPVLRESQAFAQRLPYTGMIPTIDLGDGTDLYPKNKSEFVHRMADLVLTRHYGKPGWRGAPAMTGWRIDGSAVRISVRDAGAGLWAKDGAPPREFVIAGEDRKFVRAEAKLDGTDIVVTSAAVAQPVAVRYAWEPNPTVNVVGETGLPLLPFRTDHWPVPGEEWMPQRLPVSRTLATVTLGGALLDGTRVGWTPSPHAADPAALQHARVLRSRTERRSFFAVPEEYPSGSGGSAVLTWTARPAIDPSRGVTIEVETLVNRLGHPLHGCDLEVGVRQTDGRVRRYLLSVLPLRVHAFHRNEVRVLASNVDHTAPHRYRLAIRGDGIAQVYLDDDVIGTLDGDAIAAPSEPSSYVRVGKSTTTGEWVASLHHVAIDAGGAFSP